MAKSKSDNPVIGTVVCTGIDCEEQATVHQFSKGTREGELYLRCTECGPDMRKKNKLQNYISKNADFREGYEHLSTADKVPEVQQDDELETEAAEVEECDLVPAEENSENTQKTKSKTGLIIAGVGLSVATVIGVFWGVKPK